MIYLDHAAATPVSQKAILAMRPFFDDKFFNPSSPYLPAVGVRDEYEAAKDTIARAIGGKGADLVITAGATESINLAFTSVLRVRPLEMEKCVVVSAVEHATVMEAAKRAGGYDVVAVDESGVVDLQDLKNKITPETRLVSIALASGELGAVQPMAKIADMVRAERLRRLSAGEKTPIYLHSDASQGVGVVDVKVARLGVDMLSINSGKVYGPKGVGALWIGHDVRLSPVVVGGGQENGLRSGTENVAGVIGFAAAIAEATERQKTEQKRLMKLKDMLREILAVGIPYVKFLGDPKRQLANFLPISVAGVDAERLIYRLEEKEIYVSTGAACAANKGEKSQTLMAIGLGDEEIAGSLRISLGKLNNEANVRETGKLIAETVREELGRG